MKPGTRVVSGYPRPDKIAKLDLNFHDSTTSNRSDYVSN